MIIERLKTDDIPQLIDLYFQLVDRKTDVYAILVSSGYRKKAHAFYEKMGYTEDVVGFRKGY